MRSADRDAGRAAETTAQRADRAANSLLLPLVAIWLLLALYASFFSRLFGGPWTREPIEVAWLNHNIFLNLFHQDMPVALALVVLTLGLWLALRRGRATLRMPTPPAGMWTVLLLALFTFMVAWAGRVFAHYGHDLVLDEFIPSFQAQIFLAGRLLAPIDPAWATYVHALQPDFVYIHEDRGLWIGAYRPGHALLRAAAMVVGADALLNPMLAAGSVLLIARLARVVLAERPDAPVVAAALLVASPQFLTAAASGFSFTAHLFCALLWLGLFLRGDLRGHAGAALVGAFAIGLHQVHVHPIFAAPYLLAHLFGAYGRSLGSLTLYALAYGIALPVWILWPEIALAIQAGDAAVLPRSLAQVSYLSGYDSFVAKTSGMLGFIRVTEMPANLLRFSVWLSPALLMLVLLGHRRVRALPLTVLLGLAGAWLMLAAHAVLMPHQTHGWGYRYLHPVLGSLVLVAVAAFPKSGPERAVATTATGVFLLASALVLTPWRFVQVEEEIRPRAQAEAFIAGIDADVVVVENRTLWFSPDFMRNDPLLRNRPLVMADSALTEAQRAALEGLRVVRVGPLELARFGIGRGDWVEPVRRTPPLASQ